MIVLQFSAFKSDLLGYATVSYSDAPAIVFIIYLGFREHYISIYILCKYFFVEKISKSFFNNIHRAIQTLLIL